MNRPCTGTVAILGPLLACAASLTGTESLANTNQKFGNVGPFEIIRIYEGNDYTRCAASMGKGNGMLRISYTYDGKTIVSVPGTKKSDTLIMYMDPPGDVGYDLSFPAKSDGSRSWADIDTQQLKTVLRIKKVISVQIDGKKFAWNIGNTSLVDVLAKVKQCVK